LLKSFEVFGAGFSLEDRARRHYSTAISPFAKPAPFVVAEVLRLQNHDELRQRSGEGRWILPPSSATQKKKAPGMNLRA
jgi:hypothetical protein